MGYGFQYYSTHAEEVGSLGDMALVLMVGSRNDSLGRDMADMNLRETPLIQGYSHIDGLAFALVIVDFTALAQRLPEEYIAPFSDDVPMHERARHWWYDHFGQDKMSTMRPQDLEGFDEVATRFLQQFTPEQRLRGLDPEQRLKGLSEADQVLALPDHLLRLLPESYLATLPAETLSAVRGRLAH